MKPGFHNTTLDVRTSNGLQDQLLEDLRFTDTDGTEYLTPATLWTDGGSTPSFVRGIPGFNAVGVNWFEYVQHDASYQGKLLVFRNGEYVPANLTQKQSDDLLSRAMKLRLARLQEENPTPWYKKPLDWLASGRNKIIWGVLRVAGWKAYNDYRKPETNLTAGPVASA